MCLRSGQDIEPSNRRHSNVRDDYVGLNCRDLVDSLFPAKRDVRCESFIFEKDSQSIYNCGLIIDYEHRRPDFLGLH